MNDLPPLSAIAECLYTAVLSDVLDEAGFMGQALRPFVRPLDEASVLCGFARTGLYRKVFHTEPGRNPYEIEMDLVDDLKGGEVAVLACDGPTDVVAPWGELLTTAASLRGAAGCLTDGLVRDTRGRAEMAAMDVAVEVAGVRIEPGDLIFGDVDGVVAVPKAVAPKVVARALEKVAAEDKTRDALLAGETLRQVFDRYGVL